MTFTFTVEPKPFATFLRRFAPVIPRRRDMAPTLASIALRVETVGSETRVHARATDMDVELGLSMPVIEGSGDGEWALVRHKHLVDTVAAWSDAQFVTITADGRTVTCAGPTNASTPARIDTPPALPDDIDPFGHFMSERDYPGVAVETDDSRDFQSRLLRTWTCASTEETRYYLNGVAFDRTPDGRIVLVATDGRRLAALETDARLSVDMAHPPILPHAPLKILKRYALDGFWFESDEPTQPLRARMAIHQGETAGYILTRLVDGTFPDWRRVTPRRDTIDAGIDLPSRDLAAALKRARAFTSGAIGICYDSRSRAVLAAEKLEDDGESLLHVEPLPCAVRLHGGAKSDFNVIPFAPAVFSAVFDVFPDAETLTLEHATEASGVVGGPIAIRQGADTFVFMPMRHAFTDAALDTIRQRLGA